jgi:hypothetical protein
MILTCSDGPLKDMTFEINNVLKTGDIVRLPMPPSASVYDFDPDEKAPLIVDSPYCYYRFDGEKLHDGQVKSK